MKWITRVKVDRVACPWLVARFINREAAELGAIPFDVEGVELTHDGPLCSVAVRF
ncbi:MAG TPA: chromate resistance protein ChrB domain-containing protein [Chthoniobacterales bacterium]